MPENPPSGARAGRREARRRARRNRLILWLAAAAVAVAGLLLLSGTLRTRRDLSAALIAPKAEASAAADARAFSTHEPNAGSTGEAGLADEANSTVEVRLADEAGSMGEAGSAPGGTAPRTGGAAPASGGNPSASAAPLATLSPGDDFPSSGVAPSGTAAPSPAPAPVTLTLSAAGDCTLGGDPSGRTNAAFARAWKRGGADYFLKNVREIFESDDLTVVNLEGPLTNAKRHREKEFAFRGEPAYAKILVSGGVEAANLANNHAQDYYGAGLSDTASALKKAGIARFGWGKTAILTVKGVKVGFCGFGVWYVSKSQMQKQIAALKKQCDLVVASIHGGEEGEGKALKVQREYGRAAVRAGANLVLGHHPHVVGGIERYEGVTIVYSLGNFCFGGNVNPDDKDTFIFQETFEIGADGPSSAGVLVIPCSISGSKSKNDYQPTPLSGGDAERVLRRIEKLSRNFETPVDLTASRTRLNAGNP